MNLSPSICIRNAPHPTSTRTDPLVPDTTLFRSASLLGLIRPAGQRRATGGDRDRLELALEAVALRQKAFDGGGIAHRDRLARDREARRSRRDDDRIAALDQIGKAHV